MSNRRQAIIISVLLCLVKEDGPVLAWSIYCADWALRSPRWTRESLVDIAQITVRWLIVFFVIMAALTYFQHQHPDSAIMRFHGQYYEYSKKLLLDFSVRDLALFHAYRQWALLSIGLAFLIPFASIPALRSFLFAYPAVFIVCLFSSAGQYVTPIKQYDGINAPSRFGEAWALLLAVFVLSHLRKTAASQPRQIFGAFGFIGMYLIAPTLIGQMQIYSFSDRWTWFNSPAYSNWPANRAEFAALSCIDRSLPFDASMKVSPPLFEIFSDRSPYFLGQPAYRQEKIDLMIYSSALAGWGDPNPARPENFSCQNPRELHAGRLAVWSCPESDEIVDSCLKRMF